MADLPIACSLQPGELKQRADELLPGLARTAIARASIAGGYRFEFPPSRDMSSAIAAVIEAEHQCCRFLQFQLTIAANDGPVRLEVTGPAGTEEFLDDLLNVRATAGADK